MDYIVFIIFGIALVLFFGINFTHKKKTRERKSRRFMDHRKQKDTK